MNLTEVYAGENEPFEGDLTLWLRALPEGASATRATLTLKPVAAAGGTLFRESIRFGGSQGELGATLTTGGNFLEVDFHARRTLLRAAGAGNNPTLQVDMGGAFIGVAADGTFIANGATPWAVDLTAAANNLPALTVGRFRLTEPGAGSGTLNLNQVDIRSVPSNLQVRLGQMAPFWVRLGDLTQTETSPDFSEVLNFFLTGSESENGFFQLPLVIHSDTLARLEITLDIAYVIEQAVVPPHLSEVNLPYDYSTLPGAEENLLTARLPRGAVPVKGRTGAEIRGTFEPSRLALGEPGETPAAGTVAVSPQCSLAQPVAADREISLSGIDLPLAKTKPGLAGLNVSLVEDADGKPSGEVLASAEVRVGKPLPDGTVWGSATLPERFRILPGVRHWLVLQSRDGGAYWSVAAGSADQPSLQCSRDGGLSWRAAGGAQLKPPLAALFRLRHLPERFTLPVQLQIGKGAGAVRRRLDEYAPAGKVEFSFDFADKLAEHLQQPGGVPPCDGSPVLCNPDFALPRPQDATRRLFGRDAANDWEVTSTVDLSRGINLSHERFIVLSVDGSPPRRIDCAGADPARTRVAEIIAAINRAAGAEVAGLSAALTTAATTTGGALRLVSPQGDAGTITLHPWCELGLPECWEGTGARIHRLRRGRLRDEGQGFALMLADGALVERGLTIGERTLRLPCYAATNQSLPAEGGAVLRQRFPVSPQCSYLLSLSHQIYPAAASAGQHACRPEALEAPSWEIEWFDAGGASLQTRSTHLEVASPEKGKLVDQPEEIRLVPPENAAEAELRILHPAAAGYGVAIGDLSLTATAQAVRNGDFSRWEEVAGQNVPAGWMVESGWTEKTFGGGVLLRGDGPEDTILVQQAEVSAEVEYLLRVRAVSASPVAQADNLAQDARARLELSWWQGDTPVGDSVTLTLDDRAFPSRGWRGASVQGADRAELRLIQPQGEASLAVKEARFEKLDLAEVPLTFLGESPGQLKVSDLRVAYDLPAVESRPRAALQTRALALTQARDSVVPAAAAAVALTDQPTTVISGVGKRYSEVLARRGIRTVGQLAAFEEENIEGIHSTRLLELRAAAELALAYVAQTTYSAALAARPLNELIAGKPSELARLSGQPLDQVRQLQHNLRAQHYLLDNKALEKMTLGNLAAARMLDKIKPSD